MCNAMFALLKKDLDKNHICIGNRLLSQHSYSYTGFQDTTCPRDANYLTVFRMMRGAS